MELESKVFVAGHRGLVGNALVSHLKEKGYTNILTASHQDLDLTRQDATEQFFRQNKPEYVFLCAAKVGGIHANNSYGAEFIYQNATIASNVIQASHVSGVKKLLNLGSSCIYPKFATQPIPEQALLSGALEPTNQAYAIAKIYAIYLCYYYFKQYGANFISAMPANLYGPHDTFDLENSHVLPALIRKFYEATRDKKAQVVVWGDGSPLREFLYSKDLAEALLFLMQHVDANEQYTHINVGSGEECSIKVLAEHVQSISGFEGTIVWDAKRPNGTPRKCMDSSLIHSLGWKAKVSLQEGLQATYNWYTSQC